MNNDFSWKCLLKLFLGNNSFNHLLSVSVQHLWLQWGLSDEQTEHRLVCIQAKEPKHWKLTVTTGFRNAQSLHRAVVCQRNRSKSLKLRNSTSVDFYFILFIYFTRQVIKTHIFPLTCSDIYQSRLFWCELSTFEISAVEISAFSLVKWDYVLCR